MKFSPIPSSLARLTRGARQGFSLAEVTIALAIAAGGFVSLLGLMPHGLEMSRRSADMAAKTRIVEFISSEINSMPWQNLDWTGHGTGSGVRRYFDDQGIEVDAYGTGSGSGSFLSYVVSVYLPPDGQMEVKLPLITGGAEQERFMKRALVFIASTSDAHYEFPEPGDAGALPRNVSAHALIVPEMGLPQ
jgi:uncharacterized protein (TIGR02598 family)